MNYFEMSMANKGFRKLRMDFGAILREGLWLIF